MRTPMTNVACVVMMSLAAAMAFVSARAETPVKSDLTVSADLEQGKTGPQIQVPPIQVPPIVEPNPDLSGDGIIGTDDLIMLLTHWGACPPWSELDCMGDLNGDYVVDGQDLMILLRMWNQATGGSEE